ncbi:MAG: NUDIX domain-containing protein [Chloroflexi bacterium]|nr:NUDIX domain-containing protein [Chloroflexota bacterium]
MFLSLKRFVLSIWKVLPLPPRLRWNIAWLVRQKFCVAVAAVILDDEGRLLLCEHNYRGYYAWGIPGGDLKRGEKPEDGVRRELLEETGFEVEVIHPLLLYNAAAYPHVTLVYHCKTISGRFQPNLEIARIAYFEPAGMPERILPSECELIHRALALLGESRP